MPPVFDNFSLWFKMYLQYSYSAEQDDPAWRTTHKKLEGNMKSTSHSNLFTTQTLNLIWCPVFIFQTPGTFYGWVRILKPPSLPMAVLSQHRLYLYTLSFIHGVHMTWSIFLNHPPRCEVFPWPPFSLILSQVSRRWKESINTFWLLTNLIYFDSMFLGPIDNVLICF